MQHILKYPSILLFALLILGFSAQTVSAQKKFKPGLNLGGQVGLAIANLSVTYPSDFPSTSQKPTNDAIIGSALGIIAQYDIHKYFAVEANVNYFQGGTKISATSSGQTFTSTLKTNNLQIPLLACFTYGTEMIDIRAGVGPYYVMRLSESVKDEPDLGGNSSEKATKSSDFGISSLLSLGYKMGSGKIFLAYRGAYGLSNIENNSSNGSAFKNLIHTFNLGYTFRLGK